MVEIANFNKTDDLNKIIKEIEKLIYYQLNAKNIFILFRENFRKIILNLMTNKL